MTYNPYKPHIVIRRVHGGIYNVVQEQRGKSGRILASFPSKKQAEEYKRLRRP